MLVRDKQHARMGDLGALVRASRSMQSSGDSGEINGQSSLGSNGAIGRKRRLVAMFCRMLGEQLLDGKAHSAIADQSPLSPRQRQTMTLLLDGKSEKEIATRLAISRHTVHVYVKSLYKRFDVCSRAELLAKWVQK